MLSELPTILIAAADAGQAATDPAPPVRSLMHAPLMVLAQAGIGVLVLGVLLCLWRMVKGPHLADRVLAADTMAMLVAGLVVVLIILYDTGLYYDAALVVAILGFASTVAFAQYIGAKNKTADTPRNDEQDDAAQDPENKPGLSTSEEAAA